MASNPTKSASSLLPYTTIEAAASGDVDAINAVLKHYERYIAALATRTLYDENGNPHLCVDEEMKRRLETKLITKILSFDVQKIA
ncbi:MAG: helix-turn-helix domain-containing protein [Oscillospiraceae bacterium]